MANFTWLPPKRKGEIGPNEVSKLLDVLKSDLENQTESMVKGGYYSEHRTITNNDGDGRLVVQYVFSLDVPYLGHLFQPIIKIAARPSTSPFPATLTYRTLEDWCEYSGEINNIEDLKNAIEEFIQTEEMQNFVTALYRTSREAREAQKDSESL